MLAPIKRRSILLCTTRFSRMCGAAPSVCHVQDRRWSLFTGAVSTKTEASSRNDGGDTGGEGRENSGMERGAEDSKPQTKRKKTVAQVDEELRLAMEGRAGDGGESGLELEDGKPVSMKRGIRENMFRYI